MNIQSIDNLIIYAIQNSAIHTALFDKIMPVLSQIGNFGLIWLIISVIFIFIKKYRRAGIIMMISLAAGMFLGDFVVKPIIARIRPCNIDYSVLLLIPRPSDFSFPSGHSLSSFLAATIIFKVKRCWGILAYILAAAIAFSRLYLFVHYPSDVLAGAAMGIILGLIFSIPLALLKKKSKKKRRR